MMTAAMTDRVEAQYDMDWARWRDELRDPQEWDGDARFGQLIPTSADVASEAEEVEYRQRRRERLEPDADPVAGCGMDR